MRVDSAAPPAPLPSRVPAWLVASIAVIAATSVYAPVIGGLVRQWYDDPNAAYAFIVFAAAVFAARERWPRFKQSASRGSSWGALGLAASAAIYIAGTLAADLFLLRLSLLAFIVASLWFVFGRQRLRVMAAPLVLLLVAIPLPSAVVTELTMPLQLAASQCATGMLHLAGIPVIRDGNVLTLNYITLEVAEACSGMRSLVTLIALIAVYTATCTVSIRRASLLVAAALPVAIVGNGLRVAFTAILAARIGEDAARGTIHDATGWAAFVVMCAALVAVHLVVSRSARAIEVTT